MPGAEHRRPVRLLATPCSVLCSSVHRAPGKKATVPIYKVLVRPGQESTSRPTSTEADALTTTPRAGVAKSLITLSKKLFYK